MSYIYYKKIGDVRVLKGIELDDLSKRTGLSEKYISDLENGLKEDVSFNDLYKISQALDINIKELFYTYRDIEDLREVMYDYMERYGHTDSKTIKISEFINELNNLYNKEKWRNKEDN